MGWKPWAAMLLPVLWAGVARAGQSADEDVAAAVALVRAEAAGHRLILLGEKHGTREIPDFVEALVAAYAQQGPVLLGLEIPRTQYPPLRAYLQSDGGPAARTALLETPFWRKVDDQHDGRRSHDMVDLIEAVRVMRAGGSDVAILPYDVAPDQPGDHHARDIAMAGRVRAAHAALPTGHLLVLGGNVHAMLSRPGSAPPEMQVPMGAHLRDLDPFAVDITAHGGQFWACRNDCGALDEYPMPTGSTPLDGRIYHLRIVLPRLSVGRLIGADAVP